MKLNESAQVVIKDEKTGKKLRGYDISKDLKANSSDTKILEKKINDRAVAYANNMIKILQDFIKESRNNNGAADLVYVSEVEQELSKNIEMIKKESKYINKSISEKSSKNEIKNRISQNIAKKGQMPKMINDKSGVPKDKHSFLFSDKKLHNYETTSNPLEAPKGYKITPIHEEIDNTYFNY